MLVAIAIRGVCAVRGSATQLTDKLVSLDVGQVQVHDNQVHRIARVADIVEGGVSIARDVDAIAAQAPQMMREFVRKVHVVFDDQDVPVRLGIADRSKARDRRSRVPGTGRPGAS